MIELSEIIKNLFEEKKVSPAEVARRSGVPAAQISQIVNGVTKNPTWKTMVLLAAAFGESISIFDVAAVHVAEPPTDYITMPVRTLGGAGDPCDLQNLEPIRYITLHKDYDGPSIQIVEVRGRSMEPNIMNGAMVGVDVSDKHIESGELYACYIQNEGIVVKRIFMAPDTVTIHSDNKNHGDNVMMMDRINWDTFICGRVKWVLQKY